MKCCEITKNGARALVVGHIALRRIAGSLVLNADAAGVFSFDGEIASGSMAMETVRWGEVGVQFGDEIKIRIVDFDSPDAPQHTGTFGRVVKEETTEEFCSFCGRGQEAKLVRGAAANICDECVVLAAEIVRQDKERQANAKE